MPKETPVEAPFEPAHRSVPGYSTADLASRKAGRSRIAITTVVLLGLATVVVLGVRSSLRHRAAAGPKGPPGANRSGGMPVPIIAGTVKAQDVPIYLDGLGTVQAFNTVTVRARVDGQVERIHFTEGQNVHTGDLLAQIDPAPFQAALDQALAKKAEDEAQLAVARLNLKRDMDLLASKIVAQQDYDTQKALVQQLEATVNADQAAVDNAKVQLNYTRITSPLDGRVGIRQVDQGNIVHANDSNGIVVITQLQPISVVFTLPEQDLADIQRHNSSSEPLAVLAVDRNNRETLDQGQLAVVDNQIDTATGTLRLKATFSNTEYRLWPGQFVNARLLLTTRKEGLVVPAQVVQRGPEGSYAFVIQEDDTVAVRAVKVAQIQDGQALLDDGLHARERVVVDGQYKLRPGSHVKIGERPAASPGGGSRSGSRPKPGEAKPDRVTK
jgi:multidrug efflux system membrane fusion protein